MSPTKMIKKAVCTLAMALCAVPFWNCGSESPEGAPTGSLEGKTASVALRVTHVEVPLMDSIVVECVGADSLHLTAGAKDARFDLDPQSDRSGAGRDEPDRTSSRPFSPRHFS